LYPSFLYVHSDTMNVDSIIIRLSPIIVLFRFFIATLIIAICYGLYIIIQLTFGGISLIDNTIHPSLLFVITLTIESMVLVCVFLKWAYTFYEVNDKHIIKHQGIFSKRRITHTLENIQTVEVEQNIFGLLLHFGNIRCDNPLIKNDITLNIISDPQKYVAIIRKILSANHQKIIPVDQKSYNGT